jgi:hypothetical protein
VNAQKKVGGGREEIEKGKGKKGREKEEEEEEEELGKNREKEEETEGTTSYRLNNPITSLELIKVVRKKKFFF